MLTSLVKMANDRHRNSLNSSTTDVSTFKDNTTKEMQVDSEQPCNIWRQMAYVPPRGGCGFKYSVVSPACPCLRFMLHPLKLSSSFECDGCGHHASFHQMRSKTEDETTKDEVPSRFLRADGTFDREAYEGDEEVQEILAKRRRLGIEGGISSNRDLVMPEKARSTLMETGKKRTRVGLGST